MIDFRVLGPLGLNRTEGEEILSVLSQPKRIALLAYLALAPDLGFRRRDTVVALFWPGLDQERARGALRKSLYFLRRSLGEEVLKGRGDEEVALAWPEITCDAVEFEKALAEGDVEGALELYRGDLLEGLFLSGCPEFEKWLEGKREHLRERAAAAAWELAHRHLSEGRITEGERVGQRALSLVPTDENEVRRFIRSLNDAGDRAAAVRFYEKFAHELDGVLELRPSAETRALAEAIRNTMGTPAPSNGWPSPSSDPPTAEPSYSSKRTGLLQRVRAALAHRYSVEREIGRGGMATVFLAGDPKHRRKVALKVLDPELSEALGARRFLQEIAIAANLTHPHILPLFDSGETDGLLFYVMPFVDGESLRTRLERERQLPVGDALAIARDIAGALAFAHEKGVIHRDVKPANILLEAGHAVLADFGVAHAVVLAEDAPQTRSGVSLGTPAYMSPEQSTAETTLDGRSDQYSLGCVLYEMLAGEQPFRGPSGESVTRQHLTRDPSPISDLRPSVPGEIAYAIHRALSKTPADRYSSMREFSEALTGRVREARPPVVFDDPSSQGYGGKRGDSEVVGTGPRRHLVRSLGRWGWSALALSGLLVSAVLWLSLHRESPSGVAGIRNQIVLAIMPFTPVPEQMQDLSEGIATLMGIALDEVGDVRTVDRNALFPHVGPFLRGERLSLSDAQKAAEEFGATHLILGEGVGVGGEQVTLAATLYSVKPGSIEPLENLQVAGSPDDPNALADSLARQTLAILEIASGDRLSGAAALTTHSAAALRVYLRGEQEFRATRYSEAYQAFDEAVKIDPSFALAHYRRSLTAVLILRFDEARVSAAQALRLSPRLNQRSQKLVRAWAELIDGSADAAEARYETILLDYPDEVEAHFGLGEVQVYFNPVRGRPSSEAKPHFERVLQLIPNFGQARFHLLEFATRQRDQAAFDSLYISVDPSSDQALAWAAVKTFWRGGADERREIEDRVRLADPVAAGLAVARVAAYLRDYQAAEDLASLLITPARDGETRCAAHLLIAMMRFGKGQWEEGMHALEAAGRLDSAWATELRALFTGVPFRSPSPEEIAAIQENLLAWDASREGLSTNFVLFAHNGYHPYLRVYLLALTRIWAGDPDGARSFVRDLPTMPNAMDMMAVTSAWAQSIRGRAFALQGHADEAILQLRTARANVHLELIAISPFFSRSFDRFALGKLLRGTGQVDEALRWFETLLDGHELVLVGPAHLEIAQILEERGDNAGAIAHYSRFVEIWGDADSDFQTLVHSAREKIFLLRGES